MLKKYQPGRTDLLINTDWGIPHDGLTIGEAQSRNMRLFHDRWVTVAEKKQLKDEHHAYRSIRITGSILMLLALPIVLNIGLIAKGGILSTALTVIYALVAVSSGIGLIQYRRVARHFAVLIFISFFILPFTVLLSDEKGAPFLIILGIVGLYYLLRRTARKIFSPSVRSTPGDKKNKRSIVRKGIYWVVLFVAFFAGYMIYDMSRAKHMADDACLLAAQGLPLEDFLSKFSGKDYKIIQGAEYILIVPKRGMGRNHCTVAHDGMKITGAKAGFAD